jgi:hypothetical protein
VFSSYEFASIGAPTSRIDGLSFRIDGANIQPFLGSWQVAVYLSTTTQTPDGLSTFFADNAGLDGLRVFGGSLGIFAPSSSGIEPRPFQVRIPFATPFFYDPSRGNLSLYIVTGGGPLGLALDAQFASGDAVGRVFADGDSLDGTVDTLGLVTRFDITPVPEPPPIALCAIGALAVVFIGQVCSGKRSLHGR